jgi:hypothetical protein
MADLQRAQIGWKGLEDIINQIIDHVNSNTPIEGDGIRIVDGPNGKVISAAILAVGGGSGASPAEVPAGVGWRQMAVKIPDASGHCVDATFWYWGTAPVAS